MRISIDWLKDFIKIESYYKKLNVRIYNANLDSRMDHITKCSLKDAIEDSMK